MPLQRHLAQRPAQRLSPRGAKIAAIILAVLVAFVDFAVPTSLQLSISLFYGVVIALCAWTGSRTFLWSTTVAVTVCLLSAGLIHSIARHQPDLMLTMFNRSLRATLLVAIARIVHGWMTDMKLLEAQRTRFRNLTEVIPHLIVSAGVRQPQFRRFCSWRVRRIRIESTFWAHYHSDAGEEGTPAQVEARLG
jgi:hypothetical protein